MIESDVLEWIAQGEGAQIEFKEAWPRPEQLAREIVSFANMHGGVILIGVSDSGKIIGIKEDKQEWLMDTVLGRFVDPFILPKYQIIRVEDKKIAVIDVPKGTAQPYMLVNNDRRDTYVRVGSICRLATREQQQRLFESGGYFSVEKQPIHGASIDTLEERRLQEYFCDKLKLKNDWKNNKQELMQLHSFLVKQENNDLPCSYFACALFGKSPIHSLPQAGIRLLAFDSVDMEYDAKMDEKLNMPFVGLARHKETGYSEPSLIDQTMKYLQPHISRDHLDSEVSAQRQRQWDYPPEAVRELIINAFAHRDWTRQNTIEVAVFSNRMEIISPGALPNGMTVEKIKAGERTPRNNKIVNIFRDYGFVEDRGMGIRVKVIPLMQKKNSSEPEFDATEDHFRVTLYKKIAKP